MDAGYEIDVVEPADGAVPYAYAPRPEIDAAPVRVGSHRRSVSAGGTPREALLDPAAAASKKAHLAAGASADGAFAADGSGAASYLSASGAASAAGAAADGAASGLLFFVPASLLPRSERARFVLALAVAALVLAAQTGGAAALRGPAAVALVAVYGAVAVTLASRSWPRAGDEDCPAAREADHKRNVALFRWAVAGLALLATAAPYLGTVFSAAFWRTPAVVAGIAAYAAAACSLASRSWPRADMTPPRD